MVWRHPARARGIDCLGSRGWRWRSSPESLWRGVVASLRGDPDVSGPAPAEFSITATPELPLRGSLAFSRDGRSLYYVAFREGAPQVYRRSIGSVTAVAVEGAVGASLSVSPDNESLVFCDPYENQLKRVPVTGGAPSLSDRRARMHWRGLGRARQHRLPVRREHLSRAG